MDDLERQIRRANPSAVSRTTPLSSRAEAELELLLTNATPTPRAIRPRVIVPLFAVAAVLLGFVLVLVTSLAPREVWAATPPLLTLGSYPLNAKEALQQMGETASDRIEPIRDTQTIRMQSWALNVVDDGGQRSSFVVPEQITITRAADGDRQIVVVAGEPYDREGQPATDPDAAAPGTELWSEASAAGEYQFVFPDPPPTSREAMKAYLARFGGLTDDSAGSVIGLVPVLLTEWELTPQQESALLLALAELPDIEVAGRTTDRLGRAGVAFRTPDIDGYHQVLVVSTETGQILSVETVYTGQDRVDIQSPAVVAYYAWERN